MPERAIERNGAQHRVAVVQRELDLLAAGRPAVDPELDRFPLRSVESVRQMEREAAPVVGFEADRAPAVVHHGGLAKGDLRPAPVLDVVAEGVAVDPLARIRILRGPHLRDALRDRHHRDAARRKVVEQGRELRRRILRLA